MAGVLNIDKDGTFIAAEISLYPGNLTVRGQDAASGQEKQIMTLPVNVEVRVDLTNDRGETFISGGRVVWRKSPFSNSSLLLFHNVPKGRYDVRLTCEGSFSSDTSITADNVSGSVDVHFQQWKWEADTSNYRRVAYFKNGWYISYPNLLLYQSEEEGFVLKGKTDLPGVLCAARVTYYRDAEYYWGKRALEVGGVTP